MKLASNFHGTVSDHFKSNEDDSEPEFWTYTSLRNIIFYKYESPHPSDGSSSRTETYWAKENSTLEDLSNEYEEKTK